MSPHFRGSTVDVNCKMYMHEVPLYHYYTHLVPKECFIYGTTIKILASLHKQSPQVIC